MQNFVNEISKETTTIEVGSECERETGFVSSYCACSTKLIVVKNVLGGLIEMRVVYAGYN